MSTSEQQRILCGFVIAVMLLWGITCCASDQGIHNCRDDSTGPNTQAAIPSEPSQVADGEVTPGHAFMEWACRCFRATSSNVKSFAKAGIMRKSASYPFEKPAAMTMR